MLRLLTHVSRKTMALQPERSSRFFSLRLELKEELPLSGTITNMVETILEEHAKHLESSEEKG